MVCDDTTIQFVLNTFCHAAKQFLIALRRKNKDHLATKNNQKSSSNYPSDHSTITNMQFANQTNPILEDDIFSLLPRYRKKIP